MRQALAHRQLAPCQIDLGFFAVAFELLGDFEQALGRIRTAIEYHVLDAFFELGVKVGVYAQLPRVDNPHVHARRNRVVQEHGVNRFAHRLVATEGEGDVGHAAADHGEGQVFFDPARRVDEIHRVVVVFGDARGNRENIGVKNDVAGRKANLLREDVVGAFANFDFALEGVGLTLLVKRHDDRSRAIAHDFSRVFDELRFAFLE